MPELASAPVRTNARKVYWIGHGTDTPHHTRPERPWTCDRAAVSAQAPTPNLTSLGGRRMAARFAPPDLKQSSVGAPPALPMLDFAA